MDTDYRWLVKHSPVQYVKEILFSFRNLDRISIAGFLVIAQLFILLSAPHIWESEAMQDMVLIYFVMMGFAFGVLDDKNPFYKITLFDGLTQMVVSFLAGVWLFSYMGFTGDGTYGGFETLGLLIIGQSLVIGVVEESLFRGAIPTALDKGNMNPNVSRLVAAGAFAGFHWWAFDGNMVGIFAAFFFAILMQYIWDGRSVKTKTPGYPLVAVGLHAAWNVTVIAGSFAFSVLVGGI